MSVDVRHSPFYAWLNNAAIRELIHGALDLSAGERLVLIKGLVPGLVNDMGAAGFEAFLDEASIKAQRYAEAVAHPERGTRPPPFDRLPHASTKSWASSRSTTTICAANPEEMILDFPGST